MQSYFCWRRHFRRRPGLWISNSLDSWLDRVKQIGGKSATFLLASQDSPPPRVRGTPVPNRPWLVPLISSDMIAYPNIPLNISTGVEE